MKRALLLLLLLAAPTQAATRFYFGEGPSEVYPTPDSGWESQPRARYRALMHTQASNIADGNPAETPAFFPTPVDVSNTTTDDTLDYVFVSPKLDSGITFTSGSTTVTAFAFVREIATSDDVNECILGVRVLDDDGSTINATLLAVGSYGTVTEFTQSTTTNGAGMAKRCANAQAVTSTYTTAQDDRLLVEIGYSLTVAGTTPQANMALGRRSSTADCVTDGGAAACVSWVEFSNTITYTTPTYRSFRYTSYGTWWYPTAKIATAALTPAYDASWNSTTVSRLRLDPDWSGSRIGMNQAPLTAGTTNTGAAFQLISRPLAAGISFSTSSTRVSAAWAAGESATNDDVNRCIMSIRVLDDDGSTINATLLTHGSYGLTVELPVYPSSQRGTSTLCADGQLVSNNYTTANGDRLLVEVGAGTASSAVSPDARFAIGDGEGACCTDNVGSWEDGTGQPEWAPLCPMGVINTSATCTPWVQFSLASMPFADDPNPGPTRIYLPSTTTTPYTPAVDAGWTASDELIRRAATTTKGSTTVTQGQTVDMAAGGASEIDRQYILPLKDGLVFTTGWTTIHGELPVRQLATTDQVRWVKAAIRIVASDQSTLRSALLPIGGYYWTATPTTLFVGLPTSVEMPVAPNDASTNYVLFPPGTVDVASASYTTVAGDLLVIEIGYFGVTGTTPQAEARFGESGTDCSFPDHVTIGPNGGVDGGCVPWIEFSNLIQEPSAGRNPIVIH